MAFKKNWVITKRIFMKKIFFILMTFLLFVISCTRDNNSNSDDNILVVNANGSTYRVPITIPLISYSGNAEVHLYASSSELDVQLQAKTYTHVSGVGDYFLWCCNNDIL